MITNRVINYSRNNNFALTKSDHNTMVYISDVAIIKLILELLKTKFKLILSNDQIEWWHSQDSLFLFNLLPTNIDATDKIKQLKAISQTIEKYLEQTINLQLKNLTFIFD